MTKGEIIGSVYLKISGGEPSSDISVWQSDLEVLLAPAVNFVTTKQYFVDKQDEGERLIQPFMLQTYDELTILEDPRRKQYYFLLPKTPLSLPNGRALNFVGTPRGKRFIPLAQGAEDLQEEYCKFKKDITSYRPEGLKCYLWNKPLLLNEAMVKMLINVNEMADDETVILPSGGEIEVITIMYEWATGQRGTPKDVVIDQKDKPIA